MQTPDFDALFNADPDPWGYRTRWYEQRKRDLTLAALPRARYGRVFEPGCGNGELSAALALRCERLLAADASERAVVLARQRLQGFAHVEVQLLRVPEGWVDEDGPFDLIVISELAYYLHDDAQARLCALCVATLSDGGTLVACHWRRPIPDAQRSGDAAHAALHAGLGLSAVGGWVDEDFRIDVWSRQPLSVGAQEGLVRGGARRPSG